MKHQIVRLFILLIFLQIFGYFVIKGYPKLSKYIYHPATPKFYNYKPEKLSFEESSKDTIALGVPILMYHGVVDNVDQENTLQRTFISHMEMLKLDGYQTISLKQLDEFLDGKYTLPSKPIVITFDDGRRDSYYSTDNILKKLGFTATMFVVTARTNNNDRFFLSWKELRQMRDSGRWEIEAHGRNSHDNVVIDENGKTNKYLNSLIYKKGVGLETVGEYESRVEQDYINGIEDIKINLGLEAKYYAIPLNEYDNRGVSNHIGSGDFNSKMIQKYFKLAFIETVVAKVQPDHKNVYNLKGANRSTIARIEPRNMDADTLNKLLENDKPTLPSINLGKQIGPTVINMIDIQYGQIDFQANGINLHTAKSGSSSLFTFGKDYWSDYQLEAKLKRQGSRSVAVYFNYYDRNNFNSFGMTDNGVFIRETVNGESRDLRLAVLTSNQKYLLNKYKLIVRGSQVSAYFNDKLMFPDVTTKNKEGRVGIYSWSGDTSTAIVDTLQVTPKI